MIKVTIRENSWIAKLAAMKLKENRIAIVVGATIHLWNASKEDLFKNKRWLRHELEHVYQYKQHGFFKFLILYIIDSVKNGYHKNRFEIAAREKENEEVNTNNLVLFE